MKREVRFLAAAAHASQLPAHSLPEIAFAGRSNVGKSSLLNSLAGRRVARVSKTPGRTRQIHFFAVWGRVVFVDLPGYGFAEVPLALREQWKELVEAYLSARRQLRGVVLLLDVRRGMEEEERMLLDFLQGVSLPVVLAVTKADKVGRSERVRRMRELAAGPPLPGVRAVVCVSAVSGEGLAVLRREIEKLVRSEPRGADAGGRPGSAPPGCWDPGQ